MAIRIKHLLTLLTLVFLQIQSYSQVDSVYLKRITLFDRTEELRVNMEAAHFGYNVNTYTNDGSPFEEAKLDHSFQLMDSTITVRVGDLSYPIYLKIDTAKKTKSSNYLFGIVEGNHGDQIEVGDLTSEGMIVHLLKNNIYQFDYYIRGMLLKTVTLSGTRMIGFQKCDKKEMLLDSIGNLIWAKTYYYDGTLLHHYTFKPIRRAIRFHHTGKRQQFYVQDSIQMIYDEDGALRYSFIRNDSTLKWLETKYDKYGYTLSSKKYDKMESSVVLGIDYINKLRFGNDDYDVPLFYVPPYIEKSNTEKFEEHLKSIECYTRGIDFLYDLPSKLETALSESPKIELHFCSKELQQALEGAFHKKVIRSFKKKGVNSIQVSIKFAGPSGIIIRDTNNQLEEKQIDRMKDKILNTISAGTKDKFIQTKAFYLFVLHL